MAGCPSFLCWAVPACLFFLVHNWIKGPTESFVAAQNTRGVMAGTVGQGNMIFEGQRPLQDGLPILGICIGNLVISLKHGEFCEHRPVPWAFWIVGKAECELERKPPPVDSRLCVCHQLVSTRSSFLWSIFQDTLPKQDPCKDTDLIMFPPRNPFNDSPSQEPLHCNEDPSWAGCVPPACSTPPCIRSIQSPRTSAVQPALKQRKRTPRKDIVLVLTCMVPGRI